MAKAVISEDDAKTVAVTYSPQKFPFKVLGPAIEFMALHNSGKGVNGKPRSFEIDKIVAQQTGVAELERVSVEERVEREALVRLKELQEDAYQQAYQLGLSEGQEKAFKQSSEVLQEKLTHLETAISSIENLKPDLISFNENHIVRLVFAISKRVIMSEIVENKELILNVVKQAIESSQTDEKVAVRVSQRDFDFIEQSKEKLGKQFETLKRAKFEASPDVSDGGCIVETNYGDVDASIEQKLEALWTAMSEKFPKVKNVVGK